MAGGPGAQQVIHEVICSQPHRTTVADSYTLHHAAICTMPVLPHFLTTRLPRD
jgi:hypothetical protein